MTVGDLHEATIADEMRESAGGVVHAVVIDAKNADVFGEGGEAASAATEAVVRDGGRGGHQGQGLGQVPPQSMPASVPFCMASMQVGA